MKQLRYFAVGLLLLSTFAACKKDASAPAPYGKVTVSFSNEVDGTPVVLGPIQYKNAAGNTYSVDLLKYYVSDVSFIKADRSSWRSGCHELIDAATPESLSFSLDSVMNGEYIAVQFNVGIEPERNHSGAQDGDLDPVHGMIWSWNTGYIFFKHEGHFRDATGATRTLAFHLGTDAALTTIQLPLSKLQVNGDNHQLSLKFNLNQAYNSTEKIDFNVENNRMSTEPGAFIWISTMRSNLVHAFSIGRVD